MNQPVNLLSPVWSQADSTELVTVLKESIGGQGQTDEATGRRKWYLPMARMSCEIELTFDGTEIIAIEPGPAFNQAKWDEIVPSIDELVRGPEKIGRDYSFSLYRVNGSWMGTHSQVQMLPPPPSAPRADFESAEHPFILEFEMPSTNTFSVAQQRRVRLHRQFTLLLNVLLRGRISSQPPRTEYFWTNIGRDVSNPSYHYMYTAFWAPLGVAIIDEFSGPAGEELEEVDPAEYYDFDTPRFGVGRPLSVPSDLDDSILKYRKLPRAARSAFDRAAFWVDLSRRQWPFSISASFGSLVSAIEALSEKPEETHVVRCEQCGFDRSHDVPGAGGRFRAFLDKYTPGPALKAKRDEMYQLRSAILHGDKLMQLDLTMSSAFLPPAWREYDLHSELSGVTRIALRNWLKTGP